jgi:thioredoxin-related protein
MLFPMKKIIRFWFIMMMFSAFAYAYPPQWYTQWNDALHASISQDKPILMVFSGSDWCKPCMMLEKAVFETPDFQAYAAQHLVLLKVDFPRQKKNLLPEAQRNQNEALAEKYNPEGEFPCVLFLNAEGELITKMDHRYTSSTDFIHYLQQLPAIPK